MLENKVLTVVIFGVILAHVLVGWQLSSEKESRLPTKPTPRIVVQTIAFKEKPVEPVKIPPKPQPQSHTSPPPPKPAPKKKENPPKIQKKEEKKRQPVKKQEKKRQPIKQPEKKPDKKPVVKEEKNDEREKLLAKAKESIGKIEANRDKIRQINRNSKAETSLDSTPDKLHEGESRYRDELAGRLQLMLQLPDYGEVRVKLTLDRSGGVATMVVLSSASEENRRYVEQNLPKLKFPPFGQNFGSERTYTFPITLRNKT